MAKMEKNISLVERTFSLESNSMYLFVLEA